MKWFKKKDDVYKEFIQKYSNAFNAAVGDVDRDAKDRIKGSYSLNKIYDLFLDFIIDSKKLLK